MATEDMWVGLPKFSLLYYKTGNYYENDEL